MSEQDAEPSWQSALRPEFGLIVDAVNAALAQANADNPDRSSKTHLTCLSDYISRNVARLVSNAEPIDNTGGTECVLIQGIAILRVKSADAQHRVRNTPTGRHRRYLDREELDGLPPELPRIDLCYQYDFRTSTLTALHLVERDGDGVKVSVQLPWRFGIDIEVVETLKFDLPKSSITPRADVVAKRMKKDDEKSS